MSIIDLLYKKRRMKELTTAEIHEFVSAVTNASIADYQISAMLMAMCMGGMSARETLDLTMEMAHSGDMLNLDAIPGIKVDKHSTGGVGDTTSLVMVPLLAACGAKVAKMSGRGLGFTGGTLDKLESIPGFRVDVPTERFIEYVNRSGLAIIGQTKELAPADKTLYALRDVTATVDFLPLIVSSILSKKIAAGADVIVLDVKTGSGALMPTYEASVELAETMVDIGCRTGRKFAALVTDMSQPLGNNVGNALEVAEAIDILAGRTQGDLKTVSFALAAQTLTLAQLAPDTQSALDMLEEKIQNGQALKKLSEMMQNQGGDPRCAYDPSLLPHAETQIDFKAAQSGYLYAIHTDKIGYAAKALGAGRQRKEDKIDLAVGLVMKKRLGEYVRAGETLATMHVSEASDILTARKFLDDAICLSEEKPALPPLVHRVVGA